MIELTFTDLGGDGSEVLVVGPSLGTSVETLWGACAQSLAHRFAVIGWDLPGHGRGKPAGEPFSIADLADAVRAHASALGRPAWYAGVSMAGAVGLQLSLDPGPFRAVVAIASAPRIGVPQNWSERAELVRTAGTSVLLDASAVRWFAPGFVDRRPEVAGRLLTALSATDSASYAFACDALAEFDLRGRLAGRRVPLMMAPGEVDHVVRPDAARVGGADFQVFTGCGHLPVAEAPEAVASALTTFVDAHGGAA